MGVNERHNRIIEMLTKADSALTGASLSKSLNVSRQIIVQDINKLKEDGYEILSTPKGYMLDHRSYKTKVFKVHHSSSQIKEELNLIVDLGGEVRDVFIYHKVYGEIRAKLSILSRADVNRFCDDLKSGKSNPLSSATSGYHYHTIITKDEETMRLIEEKLAEKGFLATILDYEPSTLITK